MIQKEYDDDKEHVHVISYGGGTQSTALLLMALKGEINGVIPDYIIISDTGWEPKAVYEWIDKVNAYIKEKFGKEIIVCSNGNIKDEILKNSKGGWVTMPIHKGTGGIGYRTCTREYKIHPVTQKIREVLGYKPRKRVKNHVVHVWKGISMDEIQRAKPMKEKWQVAEHPLIDVVMMDRQQCIEYVQAEGLGTPPRSACMGCPFNNSQRWLEIRQDPESWADVLEMDRKLREINPGTYLHSKKKPLDEIDFSEQMDIEDLLTNECEGMCGL